MGRREGLEQRRLVQEHLEEGGEEVGRVPVGGVEGRPGIWVRYWPVTVAFH